MKLVKLIKKTKIASLNSGVNISEIDLDTDIFKIYEYSIKKSGDKLHPKLQTLVTLIPVNSFYKFLYARAFPSIIVPEDHIEYINENEYFKERNKELHKLQRISAKIKKEFK